MTLIPMGQLTLIIYLQLFIVLSSSSLFQVPLFPCLSFNPKG
jgi:hypothetical protein